MSIQEVRAHFESAERALNMMHEGMRDYNAASIIGDWERADVARNLSKDALDAYFDHLTTAHKASHGKR